MPTAGWRQWHGPAVLIRATDAAREGVRDAAEAILEVAKTEVPHDEGTLERSGKVVMDFVGAKAFITFGGGPGTGHPKVPYAVRWHEKQARFQKGRKYRYLVDPLNQVGPQKLAEALRQRLGRALE